MRRKLVVGWVVVGALLAAGAACSGGSAAPSTSAARPATTAAGPADTDPPAASTPGTEAPDTAPPTTEPGRAVTPLPGLLDTSDVPIELDPAVATGMLDNGLAYFVRHNEEPGSKASLRLVIGAGSANELGDETGVAHFLEHMLFNGTEKFPENELINVLRGFGAEFGPDVNAYTSYDETVYELDVPNRDESVALAIDVLHEWLTAATLDAGEVASERGVVLDEWRRSTQTFDGRLYAIASEHYLAGTAYAGRSPIGTDASIEAMEPAPLRRFYDAWYRPDNAAVVVVGDIDVDEVVGMIEHTFDAAEPRGDAGVRVSGAVGPFTEPAFVLHADPDQTTVDVEVTLPIPTTDGDGTAAVRASMLDQVAFDVLVRRLSRDAAGGDMPFDDVWPGTNSFVDGLDAPALYAFTDADRAAATLDALLDEYERAYRFGFEAAEVDAAVAVLRPMYAALYGPDRETQDYEFADELVGYFLRGHPAPDRAAGYQVFIAELDAITPAAVAERFNARYTNTAPQVIISVPERQAAEVPDAATVLAAVAAAPERAIEPRDAATVLPSTLMERPPAVAHTGERRMSDAGWDAFDPIEYTYPSGVRVILVPNKIAQGEVFLQASSPGGSAMVAPDDLVDASFAANVVTASGAGEFGSADLDQIVSGLDVELFPLLTTYTEGWTGRAASTDAEALLALLHLRTTAAQADPVRLRQIVQQTQPIVDDPSIEPGTAGADALNQARYGDSPYYDVLPDPAAFATLDVDGVERVWNDRFGDASDFVFVIAGDFDRAEMKLLADSYLGTLPGRRGIETPANVTPPAPTGAVSTTVQAGSGATASVEMLFTSPVARLHPADDALVDVATSVIEARLTKVVREQFGDSYSPFAVSWVDEDPDPVMVTYVYASGSPERIAAIGDTIRTELADLAGGGLTEAEFTTALAPVVERSRYVDNGEFLRELNRAAWNPDYDLTDYVYKYEAVDAVTRQAVQALIAERIPVTAYAEAIVTPR
ncbi:MAG TPA: insulinase family protein [Ilumatobacter sp.]|nr:insulinase family protein [Ilumatobacter sp.]